METSTKSELSANSLASASMAQKPLWTARGAALGFDTGQLITQAQSQIVSHAAHTSGTMNPTGAVMWSFIKTPRAFHQS